MRVALTSETKAELSAILDWYGVLSPSIVRQFIDEYEILIGRLAENPHQFQIVRAGVRRAGMRRFPYGLFYRIRPDRIEVIACLHTSRNPNHWQRRS
jgi:plasmid stabilization system protein ParE